MDPLTMLALMGIKAGAGFVEKTGQPTQWEPEPGAKPAAGQQPAGQDYSALLKQMMAKLFGAKPTNISPPAMQNMVGPFKPSSMPQDDPYGYGNYY